MNRKRAIWTGVLLWVVALVVGIIIMVITGSTDPANKQMATMGLTALIILTFFATKFYFKGKKVKISAREGFFLGFTFVIVGTVLDAITVIIPSIIMGEVEGLLAIYASPFFVVGVAIILLVPAIVGKYRGK